MPTIIDGSASATFATPLPLSQGGTGNTTGNVVSSQVAGALNATGSAPLFACRAWVNFNGTGTVAIRASGNVSSITDNGVGQYTVNFATAMQDVNYCVQLSARNISSNSNVSNDPTFLNAQATSGIRIGHIENNVQNDSNFVHVAIFR